MDITLVRQGEDLVRNKQLRLYNIILKCKHSLSRPFIQYHWGNAQGENI